MEYRTTNVDAVKLIGIEIKTANTPGKAEKDISTLWTKFYKEKYNEKIPNKLDTNAYGLYTEYEGDFTKPYTFFVGCKVSNMDTVPPEMTCKIIPTAKYAVFTAKGPIPESVIQVWQYVWSANLERTYSGDFELYEAKSLQKTPEIDIYIAIK